MKFLFYSEHFDQLEGKEFSHHRNRPTINKFRISLSDRSLISQLYPIRFSASTQSIHIERKDSSENSLNNGPISFRPIISKVLSKNIPTSTNENFLFLQEDSYVFYSLT